jgi:uncharacterized protein (TIGR00288 family)
MNAPNAALLIDFDNVTLGIRSDLQTELRRLLSSDMIRGKVAVQRAYADWRRYPQYIVPLSESSIDLIFAPAFGPNKKNATDIRLAIDALELVFTRPEIGTFILLSGDSDFSALVLKLKEYGKYVIGVGIRDSSSDLLIQNCDEYYSYSELTGLTKTGELEPVRRDPWELVVQAIAQMARDGDVMRSDRLKQVMMEIDPNFDEKDAGFSRFSKFVVEAGHRGLLALRKSENGQYEVGPGPQANVDGFGGAAPTKPDREAPSPAPERRRGRGRAESTSRQRGGEAQGGLVLAAALELLRASAEELAGADGVPVAASEVQERMRERHGADDPVFATTRFARLLRQAHDASVVDLKKRPDGSYEMTPKPPADAVVSEEADASEEARPRPRRRGGRTRVREQGPSEGTSATPEPAETAATEVPSTEPSTKKRTAKRTATKAETPPTEPSSAKKTAKKTATKKSATNPRYRRGSRGRTKPAAAEGPVPGPVDKTPPATPAGEDAAAEPATPTSWGRRPRGGGRRPRKPEGGAGEPATGAPKATEPGLPEQEQPSSSDEPDNAPSAGGAADPATTDDETGSLWTRLSRGFGLKRPDSDTP